MTKKIIFVGTAKSGLGHLRRIASVASYVKRRAGGDELVLMTNSTPAGLGAGEIGVFSDIIECERQEMAARLADAGCDLAVLDTVKLPGFERFQGAAALILRETPSAQLAGFEREGSRPWDVVVIPNPKVAWDPQIGPDFARCVVHAGWILRETGRRGESPSAGIVVATGGGGTAETRLALYPQLDRILAEARRQASRAIAVRQALGPRSGGEALSETDEIFEPGSTLNDVFRRADLVISTAGYNSVLELASTDTPALLVAIPRSLDDQLARVRHWGPLLGHGLEPGREIEAAAWLAAQIERPCRRLPVDLGAGGAERAADALLEALCPVS